MQPDKRSTVPPPAREAAAAEPSVPLCAEQGEKPTPKTRLQSSKSKKSGWPPLEFTRQNRSTVTARTITRWIESWFGCPRLTAPLPWAVP
jgi:hypothetical protein